ncbi:hypothetical protein LPJ72_002687 [Coemansia sp. Benny D160-2]|nr:hypothetical protein LPJ72_002687 [Coemansia sp. Benny D160-2]
MEEEIRRTTRAQAADTLESSRPVPRWTAPVEFPDATVNAIAGIGQAEASPTQQLDAKLRLLQRVRLESVPPALLSPTVLTLYINAGSEASQRYVNGLVGRLAGRQRGSSGNGRSGVAVFARLEAAATGGAEVGLADPFASPHSAAKTADAAVSAARPAWHPDSGSSHALVYVFGTRLVLHLLASHARGIEPLALALAVSASPAHGPPDHRECRLSREHAFIARLEELRRAETARARIQRTLSAENILQASRTARKRQRRSGVITMADIERLATPEPIEEAQSDDANDGALPTEDGCIEAANKRLAKQLIIAALKTRGIARNHPEFAALWGQIYRSLKFALRENISRRKLSMRILKAETNKHVSFYCSS